MPLRPTDIAKMAVEKYIKENEIIPPPENLGAEFKQKRAGVFVTIEKKVQQTHQKELRGCIGTYLPTKENIVEEIISNAISAATQDPRFGPVQQEELPELSYSIYIIEKPEKISSKENLNPEIYGIIVKSGLKTGLLLPALENIRTIDEQLFYACQKAGINPENEKIEIYRFKAKKYQ